MLLVFSPSSSPALAVCLSRLIAKLMLVAVLLSADSVVGDPLVISEFAAVNDGGIRDVDGADSDWIEICNVSAVAVNTAGWVLTDDSRNLAKWRFPSLTLEPKEYLVVFASGKDRRDPSADLHTNFQLRASGEYLALLRPDSTVVTEFAPRYPSQFAKTSYGTRPDVDRSLLLESTSSSKVLVPTDDSLGLTWTSPLFDDSTWPDAVGAIGFDRKVVPTYDGLIATDVGDAMFDVNSSIYVRSTFQVPDPQKFDALVLRVRVNDGFVAFLNGQEITRKNAPTSPAWNSGSGFPRSAGSTFSIDHINLSPSFDLLTGGTNVLAIHGLNRFRSNEDFLLWFELEAITVNGQTTTQEFFEVVTPGWPNGEGAPTVAPSPVASLGDSVLTEPAQVELTSEATSIGGEIRYTTDRSDPTRLSPLYRGPITVDGLTDLRARVFLPGAIRSPLQRRIFTMIEPDLINFESNLPLVIFSMLTRVAEPNVAQPGYLFIVNDPSSVQHPLSGPIDTASSATIRVRGSGSAGRPKLSFAVETQDVGGNDFNVEPLGMPAESDWILYGAYNRDYTLMRNALIYDLSNQAGLYAVRTQHCELFLTLEDSTVSSEDYHGVYSWCEKVKRAEGRVEIDQLLTDDLSDPDVSGGYIFKIDRLDSGDRGFSAGGRFMQYVEPKEQDIQPEQSAWLINYINEFAAALNGPNFTDPFIGYERYIDVESWIDHHLFNAFAYNADGLRLSTFLVKPRGQKLRKGPIWDFDLSMGSEDSRAQATRGWSAGGTQYRGETWWSRLFQDQNFCDRYMERWLALRQSVLGPESVHATIDRMAVQLAEPALRNRDRWWITTGDFPDDLDWQDAVNDLKNWVEARAVWIDTQAIPSPEFSQPGGEVSVGFEFEIGFSSERPSPGQIVYTVNGPDPMGDDRRSVPEAISYDGAPVTVSENVRIRARTLDRGGWSNMSVTHYVTDRLPLVVSEVMYNPMRSEQFSSSNLEFVELLNIGDQPIDLVEAGIGDAPDVVITGEELLRGGALGLVEPDERVVLVKNVEAFASRYGTETIRVAGIFSERDSLSNSSQEIRLLGTLGEEVLRFTYLGSWYPTASGQGHSLVLRDPTSPVVTFSEASAWMPSPEINGSPGRADLVSSRLQLPSDLNQDSRLDIGDVTALLGHLFDGLAAPCFSSESNTQLLDANGDRLTDVSDAIYVLNYLFAGGAPPALGVTCTPIEGCPEHCVP